MKNPAGKLNSLSDKIIRNTLFNTLGKICGILTGLFLTPYIISRIGIERFGVWAIAGVLTGYFGLLDFGVSSSFVKYIAEFYTKREYGKIGRLVETGFTLYCLFAAAVLALVIILIRPIVDLLHIPAYLHSDAAIVFVAGTALFGAANAASPFLAVQGGLQRMDISNAVIIITTIVNAAGTVYFLEKGYGLVGLIANAAIVFVTASVINTVTAFRILPQLRFRLFAFDPATFASLFRFGYKMQIAKISGMITAQTEKMLIAALLSIGLVTFYQVGSSIVAFAVSIAMMLTSALMPAFSEIEAKGDRPRLIEAYLRSVKYFAFIIVPLFTLIIVTAPDLIFIWMGSGFGQSSAILRILALAFMINAIAQVPASVSVSIDKPGFMATGSVITIVSNIILSVLLIRTTGFLGAAWGTLLAVNLGTAYFLYQLHAGLKMSAKKIAVPVASCLACAAAAAALIASAAAILNRYGLISYSGRVQTLAAISAKSFIFLIAYLFFMQRIRVFTLEESAMLEEKVPLIGPVIGRILRRV